MTTPDLAALGEAVRARRAELRLTKQAAARKVPMSVITWTRVEEGLPVREMTYSGIDHALGWPAGASLRHLYGDGDPMWADVPSADNPQAVVETVGPVSDADNFVATGSGGVQTISNEEVLARLRRMRQELDEIERGLGGGGT